MHTGLRNFRRPGVRTASLVPILALAKSAQNGTLRTSRHTIGAIATHVGNRTALVRAAGVTGKYRTSLAGDAFAECILVRARDVNELRSPALLPPDLPGPRLTAPRVRRGHQSRTLIHVPPINDNILHLLEARRNRCIILATLRPGQLPTLAIDPDDSCMSPVD